MDIFSIFRKLNKRNYSKYLFPTPPGQSNDLITYFSYRQNPTAQFCVQKIASTVANLPIYLFVRNRGGGRQYAAFSPLFNVIKNPSITGETAYLFYSSMVQTLYNSGNVYLHKYFSGNKLIGFQLLDSNKVSTTFEDGAKHYHYDGKSFTDNEILHIPSPVGYNGLTGQSTQELYSDLFSLDNMLDAYIKNNFQNNIGSRLVLKLGEEYKDVDLEAVYDIFQPIVNKYITSAQNSGKPILLPFGVSNDETTLGSNNKDTQLSELKKAIEEKICQAYSMPYELISSGANKYDSLERRQLIYLQDCIAPLCTHLVQSFAKLLSPSDQASLYFAYNFKSLLKTDSKSEIDMITKEVQSGILTLNEARDMLDMNALEAGDYTFIPVNLMPLTQENIAAYMATQKKELKNEQK